MFLRKIFIKSKKVLTEKENSGIISPIKQVGIIGYAEEDG